MSLPGLMSGPLGCGCWSLAILVATQWTLVRAASVLCHHLTLDCCRSDTPVPNGLKSNLFGSPAREAKWNGYKILASSKLTCINSCITQHDMRPWCNGLNSTRCYCQH